MTSTRFSIVALALAALSALAFAAPAEAQELSGFNFELGNQTNGTSGKHTFVLTYPKIGKEAWAEVGCHCFDGTFSDTKKFALDSAVSSGGRTGFDRKVEDYGKEDFDVKVWEGSYASKSKDKLLHEKTYELTLKKNQVVCTAVPRPIPKENRAEVQLDAIAAQEWQVVVPLMVRSFIDGKQVKPDTLIAKENGTVTLQFSRSQFPEPKVYSAKLLVYYDAPIVDAATDDNAQCVVTVDIDMTKIIPEKDKGPVVPPAGNRDTPPDPRKPFTWLSGKCISQAEQVKLSAIGCVIEDTIGLLLELVGVVSTGIVVYGGFRLIIATDDTSRGNAKKIITYALIGLVVVLLSFVLVQIAFGGGIL